MTSNWYLGFDPATKSLAFSISRIDLKSDDPSKLRRQARVVSELIARADAKITAGDLQDAFDIIKRVQPVVEELDRKSRNFIHIADGETVDLVPGRPDIDVSTVERVHRTVQYVNSRVIPAVEKHVPASEKINLVVEFQMSYNYKSRIVMTAIVAALANFNCIIVPPKLKNKIDTCESGRYYNFAQKYADPYDANKEHSRYNFEHIEKYFESRIPKSQTAAMRGHIADSFMQILGLLIIGTKVIKQ